MVPNRTLPIVGNPTLTSPGRQIRTEARPGSILERLASSFTARRRVSDPRDIAYFIRLDRDLNLIEHETCDCL